MHGYALSGVHTRGLEVRPWFAHSSLSWVARGQTPTMDASRHSADIGPSAQNIQFGVVHSHASARLACPKQTPKFVQPETAVAG
jgi:hypothetical protein